MGVGCIVVVVGGGVDVVDDVDVLYICAAIRVRLSDHLH